MLTITDINSTTKRIGVAYEAWMQPLCKVLGIPFTALCVLMYFANNPNKNTAHELCKHRGYKKAIVSIHVETLVSRGYLERRAVEGDRRKFGIITTKKAEPFIAQAREYSESFEQTLTAGLLKDDLDRMEKLLNIIQGNLEAMTKQNRI